MGIKHSALKRKCLPEECGITAQSISTAKGKHHRVHSDPYTGGEQSGKHAKPDVTSAAANARARACAVPPSATAPTPSAHLETRAPPSVFAFPSQPVPMLPAYTMSFTTMHMCVDVP